ncbi:uncharacterized protein LOC112592498 [Melanaphis sacchari]|uniref:Protein tipE n=1 Tax=Melanaphis sacchari TaxID=742174 RepID=A0A2H8TVS5_9HEMI|nr:uncharacterized protein LOC112592498 [Melanaphis sacchari]XP_025192349.1 uncharacterized protein LOC112592498 [Melanaphis sacchari]
MMAEAVANDEKQMRSRQPSQDEGSRLLGEPAKDSFCQRIKPKVSLCLGTTAVLSFMVFLFLVPFVVDPAVSRLIARYAPEPGTCALHEHVFAAGLSKCTWSSCREGCTSATTRCHQITVNYSLTPYQQYKQDHMSPESLKWAGTVVRFLVNTEGCGYPPFVNCTTFALKYGHINQEDIPEFNHINQPVTRELYRHGNDTSPGPPSPPILLETASDGTQQTTAVDRRGQKVDEKSKVALKVFPCYYSRAYPDRVVADYDWHHTIKTLVAAVVIPWTLFVLSCTVLCYWYCPALRREFMVDKRKTAAIKNENPQLVIRRKLSKRPFSTDEEDGDY